MTVEVLAATTGMTVRNIRAYQTAGLLAAPERRGRSAFYDDEHVRRLRAIRQLRRKGFGLEAIRAELDGGGGTEAERPEAELADLHREVVEALTRIDAAVDRMGSHLKGADPGSDAARRLRERAAHWAAGANEARELDRRRARRQAPAQRIGEGLELARIAEKAQAGRAGA